MTVPEYLEQNRNKAEELVVPIPHIIAAVPGSAPNSFNVFWYLDDDSSLSDDAYLTAYDDTTQSIIRDKTTWTGSGTAVDPYISPIQFAPPVTPQASLSFTIHDGTKVSARVTDTKDKNVTIFVHSISGASPNDTHGGLLETKSTNLDRALEYTSTSILARYNAITISLAQFSENALASYTIPSSRTVSLKLREGNTGTTITKTTEDHLFNVVGTLNIAGISLSNTLIFSGNAGNNTSLFEIAAGGLLVMENHTTITGNTCSGGGGGVYVYSTGTFQMNGGLIGAETNGNAYNGNSASDGGGVYVEAAGTFQMNGGSIRENEANSDGGGVYVESTGIFQMNAGHIGGEVPEGYYGNNASTNYGGGVYAASGSNVIISGTINGNFANLGSVEEQQIYRAP
jgi:hypothetical protein